ncbi:MAG: hypothetical protein AAF408_00770 [Pseudomonadota bacterium]
MNQEYVGKTQAAMPTFEIGETITYRDLHGRRQTGKVLRIRADWWRSAVPWISYKVTHPTYATGKTSISEAQVIGYQLAE